MIDKNKRLYLPSIVGNIQIKRPNARQGNENTVLTHRSRIRKRVETRNPILEYLSLLLPG